MRPPPRSFTLKLPGLTNILVTPTKVGIAFDPLLTVPPPLKEFNAIWDTGATNTAISKRVVDECGLKPTGMTEVHFGGGTEIRDTYFVSIMLPNDVGFTQVRVTQFDAIRDTDVLIGMDIITQGDFAITHKDRKTTFSFRCPSVECLDFVEQAQSVMSLPKVGRNDPCPCGSGKKYKYCHGKKS